MIVTNLVKELKDLKSTHLIITGDGSKELCILEELCKKYNGSNKILWFPRTSQLRQSGLKALNAIKLFLNKYKFDITSIVYIVDREYIREDAVNAVKEYLFSIGINIYEVFRIQEAFSMKCKSGNNEFILYCIISGTQTCIEEDIVKLIDLAYGIKINLSGNRDSSWVDRIKREIKQILKERNNSLQELIERSGKRNLENSFPNMCAILRKIEESFQS